MEILIVDDDMVALEVLRGALEENGYDVTATHSGVEAMDILRAGNCQLVISDWEMPEMDGLELCRRIRSEDMGRYIYTILLSSREGSSNKVEGLTAGADDFITKPFEPAELTVRLRAGMRLLSLETRDVTIFALAKLAESRDPETGAHLERVRSYAKVLAETMGKQEKYADIVDANFVRLIYQTSPLHDIGKVAIPDHILLKPGRLTEEEFDMMKEHAVQGAATLDSALVQYPKADFLRMARDIAGGHHERWDGTGYPNDLAGEDIPLCARIFSLCDVYDALVSKRVYKDAFSHSIAQNIICESDGTQFDPDVVKAFLECKDEFLAIKKRYDSVATPEVLVATM